MLSTKIVYYYSSNVRYFVGLLYCTTYNRPRMQKPILVCKLYLLGNMRPARAYWYLRLHEVSISNTILRPIDWLVRAMATALLPARLDNYCASNNYTSTADNYSVKRRLYTHLQFEFDSNVFEKMICILNRLYCNHCVRSFYIQVVSPSTTAKWEIDNISVSVHYNPCTAVHIRRE